MDHSVSSIRSVLEAVGCPLIDQIDMPMLERWIFSPGPEHLKLLHWCLLQCVEAPPTNSNIVTDQSVLDQARCLGVCKSSDLGVITGAAPRKDQCTLWKRILYVLKEAKELQGTPVSDEHLRTNSSHLLQALTQSEDFWDLIGTQVNLMPLELHLPLIEDTLVHLQDEIGLIELALLNISKVEGSSNKIEFNVNQHENKMNNFLPNLQATFDHLATKIFLLVKDNTPSSRYDELGQIVDLVGDKVIGLAKILQDQQNIQRTVDTILREGTFNDIPDIVSDYFQLFSRCSLLLSALITDLRLLRR